MFRVEIDDAGLPTRLTGIAMRAGSIPEDIWKQVGQVVIDDNRRSALDAGLKKSGALINDILISELAGDHVTITGGANIPYFRIQNFGGFIQASPVTVIRRFNPSGKTPAQQRGRAITPYLTYQMARFMWAKWYQTGDQMWRKMALAVQKHGGVTLKGKFFWGVTEKALGEIQTIMRGYLIQDYQ